MQPLSSIPSKATCWNSTAVDDDTMAICDRCYSYNSGPEGDYLELKVYEANL